MLDLNITIVNYKMKDDIDICLETMFAEIENCGLQAIVHIVDNSKNQDGIKEMLAQKFPQAIYIDAGGNLGFGRSQNIGLRMAQARYYMPLNPDMQFPSGGFAISKLIDFLDKNKKSGIAGPRMVNMDGSLQYSCFRFPGLLDQFYKRLNFDHALPYFKKKVDHYLMRDFNHEQTVKTDWIMGSLMLIKKETADKIGFFDDRFFMYFEDCDLCRRAWQAGFEVCYVHDASVRHGHRRESDGGSQIKSFFTNPLSRMHLKSWFLYHLKYKFRVERRGI